MARLLILDTSSWIHRAVHSPDNRRKELIFFDMLQSLLGAIRPDYFIAALDGPRQDLERTRMFPAYKGNRPPTPDGVREQLDNCTDLLCASGVATVLVPGWEADDVIATLARVCAGPSCEVVIATGDKDLGQCVNKQVSLWDGQSMIEVNDVIGRWGVDPQDVPQVQALAGDTSDNLSGCPGVGKKYAIEYIQRFGSVEATYRNRDKLTPKKREAMDSFDWEQSLELVTLRTDLRIPLNVTDAVWEGLNLRAIGDALSAMGL